VSAVDTVQDVSAPDSPYVGLTFYTQQDSAMFFGRESEQTVLISNLRASRLTLLYAQSGAGKSSLLRAGVASRLAELAQRSFSQRGTARNIPVVFSSWRDDPTVELIGAIQEAITPFVRAVPPQAPPPDQLEAAIEAASAATDATLLVILDQFEEYFLYRSREARERPFADELAACINRPELRVHFLISIREDAYSGLGDLFKGRISNVYGNYFHLEHLTRDAAREAIEKPIMSFNELHPDQAPVEIEPGLVDAVLDQLRPDQFASGQGGVGRLADGNGTRPAREEVAAPYLQLVMKRLWDTELGQGSRRLRLETLAELGGAQTIVRTHVDRALASLADEDREATVDIFHHLVTPSGTKIALAASDLAEYTGRAADETNALLERLASSGIRILRPVPPPPGGTGGARFEISHDLLAPAILDWGSRRRAVRLEHEKEAAERQVQTEKRRTRMFRALAIGSAVLLIAATVLAVTATSAEQSAQSARQKAESSAASAEVTLSQDVLSKDPDLAALLALHALQGPHSSQAETALRDALSQLHLKATLIPPPPQRSAVFSTDGTRILTASADGTIRIWDPASDQQIAAFAGFGPLNTAAFSPDGTRIVTANDDGTVRILSASSSHRVISILTPPGGNGYAVSSATFSPDGSLIATSYADGTARVWNARTGRQVATLSAEQGHQLLAAAFSPDGKLLVIASSSGNARIYDVRTGAQQGVLPGSIGLLGATFSPDGKLVVTACGDGTARIWNVSSHKQVGALTPPGNPYMVFSAAFSPDGKQIVTASGDGVARIWDAASNRLVRAFGTPGHDSLLTAAFSHDGKQLVTASAGGLVRVWDTASGDQSGLLPAEAGSNPLRAAALSPDGTLAATGSPFGTVTIWKAPASGSGTPDWKQIDVVSLPEGDAVNRVAFSSDGKLLATAGQSGRAYVWKIQGGLPWGESDSAEGQPLNTVAFDPANPNLVLTADNDGNARIFRVSDDQQVREFSVPGWDMNAAAFSPDGNRIVTASGDGYARIWNASNGKPIGDKFGYGVSVTSAEFSNDGREILTTTQSSGTGYTDIWDATKTTPTVTAIIQEPGTNIPLDAAFSPDGSTVVTVGTDGIAREWSTSTETQVLAFAGHSAPISTVAFGGTEMITASSDGTARIWDTGPIEQRSLLPGPAGDQIYSATFDPANPRIMATADDSNGTVTIWNTGDQKAVVRPLNVPGAVSAEFSANGKFLVTAGNEQAKVWRTGDLGQPVAVLDTTQCTNANSDVTSYSASLNSATLSEDGSQVVTADADGAACVWNVSNGQLVRTFSEPPGVSRGVAGGLSVGGMHWAAFSPSGKQVVTANDDGTARLWDTNSGRSLQVFSEPLDQEIYAAWFSPDGTQVVTASNDGTARIWSTATGVLLQTLSEPGGDPVYNAAFSRNGQLVVTCSGSVAVIWNAKAGQQLTEFPYGTTFLYCEFSPDGSEVVTAGTDGQTRIFSTELAGNLTRIEQIAGRRVTQQLTASELREYQAGTS
jgi:WD40 repeat protein